MQVTLTSLEAKLLKILLEQLSDEQSCSGCNDFEIPQGVFTEDELHELATKIKENHSEEDQEHLADNLKEGDCVNDFELAGIIRHKLANV